MRKPRFALIALSTAMILLGVASAVLTVGIRGPKSRAQDRSVIPLAASLHSADVPVARKLRDLLSSKLDHLGAGKAARVAIKNFYAARGFAPLWTEDGAPTRRFASAQHYLGTIGAEGLDPKDYPLPAFEWGDPAALAAAELQVTAALLRYARHAQNGRIAYSRISPDIHYETIPVSVLNILTSIAQATNAADALSALHPGHDGYRALRARLVDLAADDPVRDIILANMERWRWLPRDLGGNHVIVNIPDYTLTLQREGIAHFKARAVVGKPSWPTPLISTAMTSITINPVWNVPRSIIDNEMLPAFEKNPDLPAQLGLTIVTRHDGKPHVYQLPGNNNALGRVRFNFPNKFTVYQHDTPDTYLFDLHMRAHSHGCVRVENAIHYAAALLSIARPLEQVTHERLRALFGDDEINIEMPLSIPVHLTYQTAFVDETGRLRLLPDIYGYDARIASALGESPKAAMLHSRKPAARQAERPSSYQDWPQRLRQWLGRLARMAQALVSEAGIDRPRPS